MLESRHCEPVSKDGSKVRDSSTDLLIAGDKLVGGGNGRLVAYDIRTGSKVGKEINWCRSGCTDLRARPSIVRTHFGGNAAYINLATWWITPLWNVPGGCTCNYSPTSIAMVPTHTLWAIARNQE